MNQLYFIFLAFFSFSTYSQNEECKTVIFENISSCNERSGDIIFSELSFKEPFNNLVSDSTYSTQLFFGEETHRNTVFYNCQDSLNLDFLMSNVSKFKSRLVKSDGLQKNTHEQGSVQIRFYSSSGKLLSSYYCVGLSDSKKCLELLIKKTSRNNEFQIWNFDVALNYFITLLSKSC